MVSDTINNFVSKSGANRELHTLPIDWLVVPFGEMISELKGGANLTPSDYVSNGVPVIPKSGVTWGCTLKIKEKDKQFCRPSLKNKYQSNMVDKSSTIIVLRDLVPSGPNIGLVVLIKDDTKYMLAQGVYGFKLKPGYSADFIAQLSNSSAYRKLMQSILVGSTQVHIRSSTLKETCFAIPPINEQKAIANSLSDVDALITSLEKLISKKRAIKTAAMQQLLTGKKRLPPFDKIHTGYKQTELGEIPEDWDMLELESIAELTSSKRIFEGDYVSNGVPFYRGQEISQLLKGYKAKVKCYISESKFSFLKNKFGSPEKGDILITAVGTLGNSYLVDSDLPFYFKDGNLIWLRKIKNRVNAIYLTKQLAWLKPKILEGAIGSSQKALTIEVLNKLKVPLPSFKEQIVIFEMLSSLDYEIRALEQRLSKTKQLKQGMMQQLLTGRTRLV